MPGEAPRLGGCRKRWVRLLTSKDPVHQKLIIPSPLLLYSLVHLVLCKQLSINQTKQTENQSISHANTENLGHWLFTRRLHTHSTYIYAYIFSSVCPIHIPFEVHECSEMPHSSLPRWSAFKPLEWANVIYVGIYHALERPVPFSLGPREHLGLTVPKYTGLVHTVVTC